MTNDNPPDLKQVLAEVSRRLEASQDFYDLWTTGALLPFGTVYLDGLIEQQGWFSWDFIQADPNGLDYYGDQGRHQFYSAANYLRKKRPNWKVTKVPKLGRVYYRADINPFKIKFNPTEMYDDIIKGFLSEVADANGERFGLHPWISDKYPRWNNDRREQLYLRICAEVQKDLKQHFEEVPNSAWQFRLRKEGEPAKLEQPIHKTEIDPELDKLKLIRKYSRIFIKDLVKSEPNKEFDLIDFIRDNHPDWQPEDERHKLLANETEIAVEQVHRDIIHVKGTTVYKWKGKTE